MNGKSADLKKRSFMDAYIDWFIRWVPDSFFFCMALTIIVAILAVAFTDMPLWSPSEQVNLVNSWTGKFWNLLAFTMQMTVLLVAGTAVAASPPAKRLLSWIASQPKTPLGVIMVGGIGAAVLGYLHWGIGMMGGIMLGRELFAQAKLRGIKVHKPILVTVIFLQFMPGSEGISGAAALFAASPGYLQSMVTGEYKDLVPEFISLADTVASPAFILTLAAGVAISIAVCWFMSPKDPSKIEEIDDEFVREVTKVESEDSIDRSTPAARMNNSHLMMYIVGGTGLAWSLYNLWLAGLTGLSLNNYNFLILCLGMVLCGNPNLFCKNIRLGLNGTWGFVLQFPFYAGIFGMISDSGLGHIIANWFISISNGDTFPLIAFIYSGLLNIAVPSGGSKFVIEAPYIIPAAIETGAQLKTIICAYQLGDGLTNMIIPFFALPYLANFNLDFNRIVPYTLVAVLLVFIVNMLSLWMFL
ncbi:short-chain fatty acid transporter [Rhodobacteraceae bacterium RKSG542]|uniref:TIGR00366 family protein n=1 Tax=Pseudovibrio flavus TaxID=2529854 RepID=UPI0012BC56F8|nr:TIGR00366 family protein [Pseudovibrio flavus]MTI17740.1 short-chain fatty acid transporter [Pseudovibrio flavus]